MTTLPAPFQTHKPVGSSCAVPAQVSALEAALALLRSMPRLRPPGAPAVGGGRACAEPGEFQAARQAWLAQVGLVQT